MKRLIIIVALALTACATTKGTYDKTLLESKQPWQFQYAGTTAQAIRALKTMCIMHGFEIADEDTTAGLLATRLKSLQDDEIFNIDTMAALLGTNIKSQHGKLIFRIQPSDTTTTISMTGMLQAAVSAKENAFSKIEKESSLQQVGQGHPLAMKYRQIVSALPGISGASSP